jgi:hypothetical protein
MNVIAEWEIVEAGYKFHMNDVAATVRLSYPANIIASARRNAKAYREAFAEIGHRIYSTTQPSRSEDRAKSWRDSEAWKRLQCRAMLRDFGWKRRWARLYLEVYVALLGGMPPRVDERSPARDDFPIAPAVPCDAFRMGG